MPDGQGTRYPLILRRRCKRPSARETREDNMLRNRLISAAIAVAAFVWLGNAKPAVAQEGNTQAAALYKLQAAFHRFGSVQDPVNGDSPEVITGRIRDMLSLWTSDGIVYLNVGGA